MSRWRPVVLAAGASLGLGLLVMVVVRVAVDGSMSSDAEAAERAVVLDFSDGLVRDEQAITQAYAEACEQGWSPGCAPEGFRGDLMAAEASLAGLCSEEDAASCLVAGWARTQFDADGQPAQGSEDMLWDGVGDYADRAYVERSWRGADAFMVACHSGNARACAELGRCMGWGIGRRQSWEDAGLYLKLACVLGSPEGCNWQGDLLVHQGAEAPEDWFERACDRGLADGCRNLVVYDGSDAETQMQVWREGCETDLRSCDFVARSLAEEGAVVEAGRLFQQACEGGVASSCESLSGLSDELR